MAARGEGGRRPGEGSSDRRTAAFTLVELLVVIVIIALLAAMSLAALYASQQSARASHTRALVTKLDQALAPRWESYRTRRLPIDFSLANGSTQQFARMQLLARRQVMRTELPDRWADIAWDDNSSDTLVWSPAIPNAKQRFQLADLVDTPFDGTSIGLPAQWQRTGWPNTERHTLRVPIPAGGFGTLPRSSLALAYARRYNQVLQQMPDPPTMQYQGAECLYLILTTGLGDDSAVDLTFRPRDVGDVDGDGMNEFIDGWGKPIDFIRWAPGFFSDLQQPRKTGAPLVPPLRPLLDHDPVNNHDPFDPMRVDPLAYELHPLIYSAGPDGIYAIQTHKNDNPSTDQSDLNDPYAPDGATGSLWRGTRLQNADLPIEQQGLGGYSDNIHNHLLGARR